MIVYRGYGIAIVGIILGSALIANLLVNAFAGHNYWDTHGWPLAAALAFDALVPINDRQSHVRQTGTNSDQRASREDLTPPSATRFVLYWVSMVGAHIGGPGDFDLIIPLVAWPRIEKSIRANKEPARRRRYELPRARVAAWECRCDNEARFARTAKQPRAEVRILWH